MTIKRSIVRKSRRCIKKVFDRGMHQSAFLSINEFIHVALPIGISQSIIDQILKFLSKKHHRRSHPTQTISRGDQEKEGASVDFLRSQNTLDSKGDRRWTTLRHRLALEIVSAKKQLRGPASQMHQSMAVSFLAYGFPHVRDGGRTIARQGLSQIGGIDTCLGAC